VRLRGDPAFLDRTGERALRTVPVRRASGSPAAPAPSPEGRAGAATVSTFLDLVTHAKRPDCTFSRGPKTGRATCLGRVQWANQRSVVNPRDAGEMRATGGCFDPSRQGSRGESADGAGRRSLTLR